MCQGTLPDLNIVHIQLFVEHFFSSDKEVLFIIDQQISQSGCNGFQIFITQGLLCCVESEIDVCYDVRNR